MKRIALACLLLTLPGCTISQLRESLDLTETKCRAYLDAHPASVDRTAKACRKLLS